MSDTYDSTGYGATAAATALVMVYVLAVGFLLQQPYDVAGGVLMAHVLGAITVPALIWLTRNDDRRTRRLILAGLGAKFVGTLARFAIVFGVYGGGDSDSYDRAGRIVAAAFRHGDFSGVFEGKFVGTGFLELLTGIVYTVTGPTKLGGFLVFSWLGFWGTYLFYRAFRMALPHADHRRYGLLIFFLPSMVFWPSSIGKDAWMTLMLGVLVYGAARLMAKKGMGLPLVTVGVLGTALVRPHITIIAVAGVVVAYMVSPNRSRSFAAPLTKLLGTVALAAILSFAAVSAQRFFKLESVESIAETQARVNDRTLKGNAFEAPSVTSPVQLPVAMFTVLFRPLPIEARNAFALFTSLEGAGLLVLFVLKAPRLRNLLPRRRAPYLTFCSIYSVLFAVAFSNISNFGILARQRVQLFPFVLAALAVPAAMRARSVRPTPALRRVPQHLATPERPTEPQPA